MTVFFEKAHNSWLIVRDFMYKAALSMPIGKLLMAAVILIGFLIFRSIFTTIVMRRLVTWAEARSFAQKGLMLRALERPIRFLPLALGIFFALQTLDLGHGLGIVADRLARSTLIVSVFWIAYSTVDAFDFLFVKLRSSLSEALVDWLLRGVKIAVVVVAVVGILEAWGVAIAPLLASFGLLGVAVALGAQDLFKNLISGTLIIAERRFVKGDWIRVTGIVEGTVEQIGFRSTMVRRFDKAATFVPNDKLSDTAVVNFSQMTHRRIYWTIGLVYSTTINQLRLIREEIEAYILTNDAYVAADETTTFVRVDRFSDSSIDMLLYCFTKTTNWIEWMTIKQELALKIKEIVENAGSSFAFPSRTIYHQPFDGEKPETFVPPSDRPRLPAMQTAVAAAATAKNASVPPTEPSHSTGNLDEDGGG